MVACWQLKGVGADSLWHAPDSESAAAVADLFGRKYVCSLRIATAQSSDFLYCGCSLIAPNVVLTAAHCVAESNLAAPMVEVSCHMGANSEVNAGGSRQTCCFHAL